MHLPHEEHEHRNDDKDRKTRNKKLRPNALLLWALTLEGHVVVQEIIDQCLINDLGLNGLKSPTINAFPSDRQPIHFDLRHLITINEVKKTRILDFLWPSLNIEILEDGEQHGSDDEPEQQIFSHVVHIDILF